MKINKFVIIGLSLIVIILLSNAVSSNSITSSILENESDSSYSYITFLGKVESTSGSPIAGATIEITEDDEDQRTVQGITGLDGSFAITFLFPSGETDTYLVKASKTNYKPQVKEVKIQSIPDIVQVDFTLEKKSRSLNKFPNFLYQFQLFFQQLLKNM